MRRSGARKVDLPTAVSSVRSSWRLLSPSSRRHYGLIVAGQMATALLDLLGVALIGVMTLVATSAVTGNEVTLPRVPGLTALAEEDPLATAAWLAVAAAVALLARSAVYSLLLRLNYRLLARCQVESTTTLLHAYLRLPIVEMHELSSQRAAYALTGGSSAAISGMLGSLSVVLTDVTLLVLLGGGLLALSPVVAVAAVGYLAMVFLLVHASLSRWSYRTAAKIGTAGVSNTVAVQESINLHRELWALGRLGNQFEYTRATLESGARARATQTLIGQVPRVVYDAALVVGALLLAAWQLSVSSLDQALSTLLVFLAAASRIIPSLLRVNGQLLQMRFAAGQAQPTFALAERLTQPLPAGWQPPDLTEVKPRDMAADRAAAQVKVSGLSFTYPGSETPVLRAVDLDLPPGSSTAVVGPTGGGKSTLADVLVGILPPDRGTVAIDGMSPLEFIARRPGDVAYIPQRVALVDGTVRDNVAVALPGAEDLDDRVWEALRMAYVDDVVAALPDGLDTHVGEHGVRFSGGQRQRIGLARALFSRPSLLILDEATSALDAETEREISDGIAALRGSVTVLVIAHRLAAVKGADQVVYLEDGSVSSAGTFEQLLQGSESFRRQVEILSMPRGARGDAPQ